ncbi:MAG TPA: HNH endonuclease signature motif containing protein [Ornithinicoccus sp.]|nr:HNH endonuclease signature motif containing protein [Ornithinicoccus sp.]
MRDRHCIYPGCSVPGTRCDSHHVTRWSRGGPTDITNLALGSVVTWHL